MPRHDQENMRLLCRQSDRARSHGGGQLREERRGAVLPAAYGRIQPDGLPVVLVDPVLLCVVAFVANGAQGSDVGEGSTAPNGGKLRRELGMYN